MEAININTIPLLITPNRNMDNFLFMTDYLIGKFQTNDHIIS